MSERYLLQKSVFFFLFQTGLWPLAPLFKQVSDRKNADTFETVLNAELGLPIENVYNALGGNETKAVYVCVCVFEWGRGLGRAHIEL